MPGFMGGPMQTQVFKEFPLYRAPGMWQKFVGVFVAGFFTGVIAFGMASADDKHKGTTRPEVTVTVTHEVIRDNP